MKAWLSLMVVLFCNIGCASLPARFTPLYPPNDPEFNIYIDDFIYRSHGMLGHRDFENLDISFKPQDYSAGKIVDDASVIGMCYWNWGILGAKNRIEIDPMYWKTAGEYEKWNLIFHEMGHCVCNLQHPDIKEESGFIGWLNDVGITTVRKQEHYLRDGCPATIMHPLNLSNECVADHQQYYIQELFSRCKPTPLPRIARLVPKKKK